jgi:hypothetical protein
MKKILLAASLAAFGTGTALAPTGAYAAHAGAPYTNVDHSNDAGNDTGDSRVDGLNANQLNENYRGTVQPVAPSGTGMAGPAQPGMAPPPPPGMAPPPPPATAVR